MHRSAAAAIACLATALACSANSSASETDFDRVLADMGSAYYMRYCASCHGAAGQGDGPAAKALLTPPANLTQIAKRRGGRFPEGEMARYIDGRFELAAHGSREMPIWGTRFGSDVPEAGVSEEIVRGKILTLVEYLKSIQEAE